MSFGFGFYTPFGLTTEWENPDEFAGRYISTLASLRTFDLNPTLAWKAGNFGFGVGAIARASDVELNQRAPLFNPFINRVVDVAALEVTSDFEWGYGYNVGLLHKFNNSFSWGLSYRSKIEIDYAGDADFSQISTGNAGLDALVRANLPVGQTVPVETSIEMPDMASFGVALMLTPDLLVEIDANWTGWSSFDELPFTFPDNPELSTVIPQNFDDAYNYRLGVNWTMSDRWQFRVGYVFDETPQPDEAVSPLLPDSDRNGFTLGVGYTGRWNIDTALMYLPFDERETSTNHDNFNGTYNTTGVLFGITLGF
jgi:long-chain fatty acid transport protein